MNISNAIRVLREKRNLTQTQLAKHCNIKQSYLSRLENEQRTPNFNLIEKISNSLNISPLLLVYLSLDEKDIDQNKRDLFVKMKPLLDTLIDILFVNNTTEEIEMENELVLLLESVNERFTEKEQRFDEKEVIDRQNTDQIKGGIRLKRCTAGFLRKVS